MEPFTALDLADARRETAHGDLNRALGFLASARLADRSTEDDRARIIDYCRRHPDALVRSCRDGHLTGSALVVDVETRRTLLIHHRKLGRWLQPGGHADGEGNLALVALTEATEETGIEGLKVLVPAVDVDIHAIPARGEDPLHLHLDVRFLVLAPSGSTVRADSTETLGAQWIDLDVPDLTGGSDLSRLAAQARTVLY